MKKNVIILILSVWTNLIVQGQCMLSSDLRLYSRLIDSVVVLSCQYENYQLQYRSRDLASNGSFTDWTTVNVIDTQYIMPVSTCKAYHWRVRKMCGNTQSEWSAIDSFTSSCCFFPPNPSKHYLTDSIVYFSWESNLPADSFNLQYRTVTSGSIYGDWVTVRNIRQFSAVRFSPCVHYEYRLQSVCNNIAGEWSRIEQFYTGGCTSGGCGDRYFASLNIYSYSVGDSTKLFWNLGGNLAVRKTQLLYRYASRNSIDTTWSYWQVIDSIYQGYTNRFEMQPCRIYSYRIVQECINGARDTFYLWIGNEYSNCPCNLTSDLIAENRDSVFRFFFQDTLENNLSYNFQYRNYNSGAWITVENVRFPYIIPVRNDEDYEWRIQKKCLGDSSYWKYGSFFTNRSCPNVYFRLIDTVNFIFNIEINSGVEINIRKTRDSLGLWTIPNLVPVDDTSCCIRPMFISNLQPCTEYTLRMRTRCSPTDTSEWQYVYFRTPGTCFSGQDSTLIKNGNIVENLLAYPNPSRDYVLLSYQLNKEANIMIELHSFQGRIVYFSKENNKKEGQYLDRIDDIDDIPEGFYLIVLKVDGKIVKTKKWKKG